MFFLIALFSALGSAQAQTPDTPDESFLPTVSKQGAPESSYALNNFFTINYLTGRMNVAIPLVTIHGRGAAQLPVRAIFEQDWQVQHTLGYATICPNQNQPCDLYSPGGSEIEGLLGHPIGGVYLAAGWMEVKYADDLVPQTNTNSYALARLYFYQPDGTSTELVDTTYYGQPVLTQCHPEVPNGCPNGPTSRGTVFVSDDGSETEFIADQPVTDLAHPGTGHGSATISGILVFKNGTKYRVDSGVVTGITDRNGNTMSISSNAVTDSLGRTTTLTQTAGSDSSHYTQTLSYPGFNGQNRSIVMTYGPLSEALSSGQSVQTLQQLFPSLNNASSTYLSNGPVIKSITLPDSSQYQFLYDSYGELTAMTLPTGGRYEFDWTALPGSYTGGVDSPSGTINRRVTAMREYASGSLSHQQVIAYDPSFGVTLDGTLVTSVSDEDGNGQLLRKVNHHFYYRWDSQQSPLGHEPWKSGREFLTETVGPNGALLQTVSTTWAQKGTLPWPDQNNPYLGSSDDQQSYDPHVASEVTTLNDTNQVSQISFAYDQYNNVTDKKEYDWGSGAPGALLRETKTTYLWASNSAYAAPSVNLVSAPSYTITDDANGNQVGETWWKYDESGPQDEPGIIGHDGNYGTGFTVRGNVTSENQWLNSSNSFLTTTFTYDIAGNVLSKKDPRGNPTTYRYDDPQSTFAFVTTVTNALGQSAEASYDFSSGRQISITDLNGVLTTYDNSDPLDRLVSVHRAVGTGSQTESHTNYSYPSSTWMVSYQDQTATEDRALQSQTVYDGFGRAVEQRTIEDSSHFIAVYTQYDALGRVATKSNPTRISGSTSDGLGYNTTYSYDALGRVTQVQAQDGTITTTSYSGNQTTVTDAAGKQRTTTTDALGRLIKVVEDPSGLNYVTSYAYDALDDLISATQGTSCPNSCESRLFTYDSLKRLTQAVNPESGTTTYSYDGDGNLSVKTDARGNTINYAYDALNRLSTKSYANNAANVAWTPMVTYTYDQGGSGSKAIGHLTQVLTSGYSITNYGPFDPLGHVRNSSQNTANTVYSFAYQFNMVDALVSETYPSGRTITTNYDSANRLSQVKGTLNNQSTNYVSGFSYAPHGAPSYYVYGNGVNRSNSFNARLQSQESTDRVTGQPNWALDLQYFWGDNGTQTTNNNGNLRGEKILTWNGANFSTQNNYSETFSYDGVNRLHSMTDDGGGSNERDFAYDQFGNMWVSNNTGFNASGTMPVANVYNGSNRLNNTNYDAAGNQLNVNGSTVSYDAEGRAAQLAESSSLGGATMTYYYDGEDRRVEKVVNNVASTVYVYDAQGQLAAEYAASATAAALCQTCYLSTDHLGSTRMVTDGSGHVVARHDYLAFGEEIVGAAGRTSLWGASDAINQKFTGKERDSESGLDYFGARYYGSALGRWTTPDWSASPEAVPYSSLEDPRSLNLYSYVLNNPLSHRDPDGHSCDPDTMTMNRDGSVTVTAGACHPDWLQFQSVRRWLGQHSKTIKTVGAGVMGVTAISGVFDGGASELAVPEELAAEEALLTAGEDAAEVGINLADKPVAESPALQKIIDQLYKPTDTAPGGTAGAVREELAKGIKIGGKTHSLKALERAAQLEKGIKSGKFTGKDLHLAKAIAQDLRNSVAGR